MKEAQDIEPTQSPKSKAQNPIKDDEIDLVELAKLIWSKRRFIVKVTSIFFVLGLIIAFTSKVEYEATCKLLPESQEGSIPDLGGLGGLAGLAGFDMSSLGGSSGVLTPQLYPEIVQSTPFIVDLIHTPVYFEKLDTTISCFQYFDEVDKPSFLGYIAKYTIGLPGLFRKQGDEKKTVSNVDISWYAKEEWKLMEKYAERFSVNVEAETGVISLETELPDAVAAAQVIELVVKKLTDKVTEYKIEKAQTNLDFIKEQFLEAEKEYEKKQKQVARFADRNRNITTSMIQTEYERLQNEMNITFEVYKGLATQLEQAKIKVKEETPVFTVLEPVIIPVDKSKPKRSLILVISTFIGVCFSIGVVITFHFIRGYIVGFKSEKVI